MTDMATNANPRDWREFRVVRFNGQRDTHRFTGEDYSTSTLAEIFSFKPTKRPKEGSPAFIPSEHNDYDARVHARQKEVGSYVALVGDIDKGNHDLEWVKGIVEKISCGSAWFIHSSSNSRPGNMRWRIIFPLAKPAAFAEWNDAQHAFFAIMENYGAVMDKALARAGQPVYLPNIPKEKDGEPLRDKDGNPLYYQSEICDEGRPGLDIHSGNMAKAIAGIHQRRAQKEIEDQKKRVENLKRKANTPVGDGSDIIKEFNAANTVQSLLISYGYTQSPRNKDDWRSPYQQSDTYATRIMDGDRWVSLSESDAVAGIGIACDSGCCGDAYDLYAHYTHKNDHKAAYRQLYREKAIASGNVVEGPWEAPPPPDEYDIGWEPVSHWEEMEEIANSSPPEPENILGFNITDWTTDRYEGEAPPIRWLLEGSIPLGVPALFAAMGGVGKSFMSLDMALEIAGEVIHGQQERKIMGGIVREHGSVVVFGAEDSKDSVHRRIASIDTGGRRDAAKGKLFVVPLPEVGGPMTLINGGTGEYVQTNKFLAVLEQLKQIKDLKLVIFDPLQAFITSNVTADPGAGQFMWSSFAQMCAATGASVIVCHHMRKDGAFEIKTAEQAREAIRGSTALIDGARATYALWALSEDDAKETCRSLKVQYQPKRIVQGAVVKSNDLHDWSVHTYIRGDNGLLMDAGDIAPKKGERPAGLGTEKCKELLSKIDERWREGKPFSFAANAPDRYIVSYIVTNYSMTHKAAKEQIQAWFDNEIVITEQVNSSSKMTGIKVKRWPEW